MDTGEKFNKADFVPPRIYRFEWSGYASARIYTMPIGYSATFSSESSAQPLIVDNSPSFNPFHRWSKSSKGYEEITDMGPASYFLKHHKRVWTLYEGAGPKDAPYTSRPILTAEGEKFLKTSSTYTELEGERRKATMFKLKGPGGDPTRTMDDFDGVRYKWKNSIGDSLYCVRSGDDVLVAHFHRTKFSLAKMGDFEVKEPVSPELLHLLFGACMVKYVVDKERRDSSKGGRYSMRFQAAAGIPPTICLLTAQPIRYTVTDGTRRAADGESRDDGDERGGGGEGTVGRHREQEGGDLRGFTGVDSTREPVSALPGLKYISGDTTVATSTWIEKYRIWAKEIRRQRREWEKRGVGGGVGIGGCVGRWMDSARSRRCDRDVTVVRDIHQE
ncbi:hypothetical protein FRB99_008492 [Tulasnella sp. 403]|nr:hypothetical protein FRB99_008492 [Tulasnella sp. 403]